MEFYATISEVEQTHPLSGAEAVLASALQSIVEMFEQTSKRIRTIMHDSM